MCAWNASKLVVKCLFRFGIWRADNLRSGQIDKHYHWKDLQFVCWYFVPGLVLTRSIFGRNACPSEEVTLTCTAQGIALFWRNEAFGELTMHYTSPPSRGEFRAKIVSYDRNQSCLVSSLSFCATASHNGTTVMCISRDRSSNQSRAWYFCVDSWQSYPAGGICDNVNICWKLYRYLGVAIGDVEANLVRSHWTDMH